MTAPEGGYDEIKIFQDSGGCFALAVVAAIAVSQTVRRAHMRGDGMFGGPGCSADT